MDSRELIESGDLELYVFGLLTESENKSIADFASKNKEIRNEIKAIEMSMLALSSSFAPDLSVENYSKIKQKLDLNRTISLKPKTQYKGYFGWAAAAVFLLSAGYLFTMLQTRDSEINDLVNTNGSLNKTIINKENTLTQIKTSYAVVKDENNKVIKLEGQAVSPTSSAKIYWNNKTNKVFVDASALPVPPEGKEYQIWSLQLSPVLTPTSIGLLDNTKNKMNYLIEVSTTENAQAFGITLEPKGGSKTPTMEQLYALGKV
jgi:anti-sigma-K factor RskA